MVKKRVWSALFLAALLLLSACGTGSNNGKESTSPANGTNNESAGSTLKPAKLKIVLYGDESNRMKELSKAEFKDLIKKEINADIEFQFLPWTEYGGGKTDLMLSTGEDFATYTDTNYMVKSVAKGLYTDLTPFMDNAAGDMKKSIDDNSFTAFQLDGKQYAVPVGNKPNSGEFYSVLARQDLLEEVGMTGISSLAELEAFYDKVHAKHPELIGYASTDARKMLMYEYTDKNLFWQNDMLAIDEAAKDDKVISWFESEDFKAYAAIMRGWYQKGIIPKYAATNLPQLQSDWNSGKAMFWAGTAARPFEGAASITQAVPTAKLANYFLSKDFPKISRGTYSTAWFVSANAADPERYVMFFNLLQKNQELYDLFAYGIKDKDYTLDENGRLTRNTTDALIPDWLLMNKNFMRFDNTVPDDFIAQYKAWDDDAIISKGAGFNFDNTPVKNEETKINGVFSELLAPIASGFLDYDTYFPKALEKLKAAGFDKYMAEYQKQFSAWYAAKS
ncbi:putative aldouronate transport system substrate-binding protein [Paenibacillus algorifonticola]|uniref:Putative aldouronate transport system substrate-binding protein n=1 Tax=Paenibacillus algorifonticola TaxID=684063 RepID=A0A1I2GJD9_9BACL|nr:ABC transporter substrate-binding protein [Paenibacillus algorifonticola]SFF16957.1 putative aldouronate transport system substrate-binding protein [Paenibacillus algorifonticola]